MARTLALLLLALFAFSAYADVFVSIDCGSSDVYADGNGMLWMGDDTLIANGQSEVVQASKAVAHVMSTLRVFTSRKKNCYSIEVDRGGQVLVRASFFYGNYDKKSAPPTFDLHFDGNFWATVQTSLNELVYYEVVYVVKGDVASVCLAQTHPNQFPFISALEVRSLGSNMYSHVDADRALFVRYRSAYGANQTIRYLDDPYDRIWVPGDFDSGLRAVASDAIIVVGVSDDPPVAVLKNAVMPTKTTGSITLDPNLPAKEVPIYINFYFAEVTELDSTQNRSFQIYIDNKPNSVPITPPYGGVTEFSINNMTASANTTFSLVPTSDSTLPPIINAMEVFYVSDPITDGTNGKDVGGLGALVDGFTSLQDWPGDPCLPSPYTWDWLNCSSDAVPRVTALYLSGYDLSGALPDFSSMDALETIDLHNNSINGPIPDFLGTLPNLKQLNLADNAFSGPIPTSISRNNKLKLVVSGNPDLCVSGKSCETTSSGTASSSGTTTGTSKKKSKLPVILGSTIPIFFGFWVIVGLLAINHHKRKTAAIASLTAGQQGNKPNATPQAHYPASAGASASNPLVAKFGEAVMNEIKVSIQEEVITEIRSELDPQTQQDNGQGGRNP